MKKILILGVLVAGLGYWALTLVKEEKQPTKKVVAADRDFGIDNINEISKIYLLKRNGKKTKLEKIEPENWIVNDTFKARNQMVNLLLNTMKDVQVYYKVNHAALDNIIKKIAGNNIKVEAYDINNKLIKCYYVGLATPDSEGSFMIMENQDAPYAVHVPQKVGSLGPIYGIYGDDWIDRTIYNINPKNIEKVSIEYDFNKDKSFDLVRDGSGFKVSPLNKEIDPNVKLQSNVIIEDYLSNFKSKIAESTVREKSNIPFLKSIKPFCTVVIYTKDGQQNKTVFYPTEAEFGEKKGDTYVQKYYVMRNDGIMLKGQHHLLKKIFVSYSYFIK